MKPERRRRKLEINDDTLRFDCLNVFDEEGRKFEMEKPVVTVVMPAYNSETTIEQSVNSIISQTFKNWELIVVVDPSKDSTVEIIKSYQDRRIRLIENNDRLGIADSRNLGVREARGDWIAFLDSDDAWLPNKIDKQLAISKQSDLIYTGSGFMDENNASIDFELHVPTRVTYKELLKQNIISCSSVLIRKKWIEKYPMPNDKKITEDYASWLSILKEIPFAVGVDEPLLVYRFAAGSDSSNKMNMVKKNWNTYKYLEVPFPQAVSSLFSYAVRSLKKYRQLKGAKE